MQVADRWHLWHNLSEAAERSIAQHRRCLRVLVPEAPETPEAEPDAVEESSGSPWPTGHRFADRTRTLNATVHALVAAGHSRRAIQRQLRMTSRTVKRFADSAKPEDLFTGQWQTRASVVDEYKTSEPSFTFSVLPSACRKRTYGLAATGPSAVALGLVGPQLNTRPARVPTGPGHPSAGPLTSPRPQGGRSLG